MRIVEYLLPNLSREIVSSKFSYAKCKLIHNKGKLRVLDTSILADTKRKRVLFFFFNWIENGNTLFEIVG